MGDDGELLLAVARHRARSRGKTSMRGDRRDRSACRRACPARSSGAAAGSRGESTSHPLAAAVRHACRSALSSSRLLVGRGREEPPAAAFLHQVLVVLVRLEAEQRQLEAVLAAGLAVAAAAVAAELGEDRHDLVGKIDRAPRCRRLTTVTLSVPAGPCAGRGRDRGRAVGQRASRGPTLSIRNDARRHRLRSATAAGQIAQLAAGILAGDDQLLPRRPGRRA